MDAGRRDALCSRDPRNLNRLRRVFNTSIPRLISSRPSRTWRSKAGNRETWQARIGSCRKGRKSTSPGCPCGVRSHLNRRTPISGLHGDNGRSFSGDMRVTLVRLHSWYLHFWLEFGLKNFSVRLVIFRLIFWFFYFIV